MSEYGIPRHVEGEGAEAPLFHELCDVRLELRDQSDAKLAAEIANLPVLDQVFNRHAQVGRFFIQMEEAINAGMTYTRYLRKSEREGLARWVEALRACQPDDEEDESAEQGEMQDETVVQGMVEPVGRSVDSSKSAYPLPNFDIKISLKDPRVASDLGALLAKDLLKVVITHPVLLDFFSLMAGAVQRGCSYRDFLRSQEAEMKRLGQAS